MDKLLQYLNGLPKEERTRFAEACETSEGYLRKACSKGQELGPDLCINIERESNRAVMCEDLRPTGVDWLYIRASKSKRAARA